MRRFLDGLYRGSGILACVFMVGVAVMILAQIAGRTTGILVPSADDISGYCMGASTFFALAYSLRRGGHIRVELLLQRFGPGLRRVFEIWCLGIASAMTAYATWWCIFLTWESFMLGDVSPGVVPIPLWLPQLSMSAGITLLMIAFVDDLVTVLRGGRASYESANATLLESDRLGDVAVAPKAG
ncbi:TRAP-type C4-dicarboxylate transport system permease small subunit [Stella humosa]|uniref:TRAP transporter small permease protein n=1 Tax=Stella humosa TaxID=94 RepID=A0A3N1MCX5_9PROT|nr:TRAP transporter small permease [Stella humosa]ROQ01448.1 TRAP-type C4-dicarboxylate transport system permease small subunit [Stella humosa]BBK31824.1 membrane protein [Stella humosa]